MTVPNEQALKKCDLILPLTYILIGTEVVFREPTVIGLFINIAYAL